MSCPLVLRFQQFFAAPAKRLPRYPRCYSVLEGVGVDNSTILLSLPRCPFPECAVRGVCVDDELQELSGGGRCARKQLGRCMQVPESTQGSGKSFFPTENSAPASRNPTAAPRNVSQHRPIPPVAEENVAVCRRRECCCLLPKRMLLPAAKENSLSGRKSVIRTQKKQPPKKKAV